MANKRKKNIFLNSSGLIKPELVAEFLQNRKQRQEKQTKIIRNISITTAVFVLTAFVGFEIISTKNQNAELARRTIDSQNTITQSTQIVAGRTTQWTKIIPISEINNGKNLIKLPGSA